MKKKRFSKPLAILLAFVMVFAMMPGAALAEGTPTEGAQSPDIGATTVTVNLTSQAAGAFMHAPKFGVEVSSNLAESYGYTDDLTDGVSALDVLVKAHELTFGTEAFTKETLSTYIQGTSSYITSAFGGFPNLSFAVNGGCPNDGVWNETYQAYTGYAINQAKINDGDTVEFFCYQDGYYLDNYPVLNLESSSVVMGSNVKVSLSGWSFCWYGCSKPETITAQTKSVEAAQLAYVDIATGAITPIEKAVTNEAGETTFTAPAEAGEYYITAYMPAQEIEENYATPLIMTLKKITVTEPSNMKVTVPSDATLKFEQKDYSGYNYKPFTKLEAIAAIANSDNDTITYYYTPSNGKDCYYTVSGEDYVTYKGYVTYKSGSGAAVEVTADQLASDGKTAKTIDRDLTSNSKYNVADIYMNINAKGYLGLDEGATYQLVCERNWQAVNSVTGNVYVEPDYHYTVVDFDGNESDIVTVNESGLLTAKKAGTAVVLVTYDAMNYEKGLGGTFFGAIWPENTGVFVVTVGGSENTALKTNMTINEGLNTDATAGKMAMDNLDAEHDVIYYLTSITEADGTVTNAGNSGEYTFKPESTAGNVSVSVATPVIAGGKLSYNGFSEVAKAQDGSFTVTLTEGRNIVRVTDGKNTEYQVITAKPVSATVSNKTTPGAALAAGDQYAVKLDTIYHPANKLAGIYNMSAGLIYADVEGYENVLFGGKGNQYQFASTEACQTVSNEVTWGPKGWSYGVTLGNVLSVPADYDKDTMTLSNGYIIAAGYGDPYGNHRGITLENGKAPNLNAAVKVGYMAKLPDITVKVVDADQTKTIKSIEVTTQPQKTAYFEGDSFDPSGMVVTITYSDDTTRVVNGGFDISPAVLSKDTAKVTISIGDVSTEADVTVTPLEVTEIAITTPPTKTTYTEGEYFNPSGMVVKATYNSGKVVEITDYQYDSAPLVKGTEKVTITYNGKTADQAITVNGKPSGSVDSDEISVYITVLGDSNHGETKTPHTYKAGNLTTWVRNTLVKVPKGAKALDVIEKVLSMKGLGFKNPDGNYITEVNGLAEFSNGPNSGWMYTLNEAYPNLGVAEQVVSNGDRIVFHYTDDYNKEFASDQWVAPGAPAVSQEVTTSGTSGSAITTTPTEVAVSGSTATATVTGVNAAEIVKQAQENKSEEIVVQVAAAASKGAETVKVQLDVATVNNIVKNTSAVVTVSTENGDVTLDQEVLKQAVSEGNGATITLEVVKPKTVTTEHKEVAGENAQFMQLVIKSGDKIISIFNKGQATVKVAVPSKLLDKKIAAVYIDDENKLQQLAGKLLTEGEKKFYEFTTPHFSIFALVDAEEVGIEVSDENANAKIIKGVNATTIKLHTVAAGKGYIKVGWTKSKGYKVDGYQVFRSVKRYSGYTKKPFFTKETGKISTTYKNTKALKSGIRYYYKVRGYRIIDGKMYYTKWSNKAWWTAK